MKKLIVFLFILLLASTVSGQKDTKEIESKRAQLKIETKAKIKAQRADMLERKRLHKVEMEVQARRIMTLYANSQRSRTITRHRSGYGQRGLYSIRNRGQRRRNQGYTVIVCSGACRGHTMQRNFRRRR